MRLLQKIKRSCLKRLGEFSAFIDGDGSVAEGYLTMLEKRRPGSRAGLEVLVGRALELKVSSHFWGMDIMQALLNLKKRVFICGCGHSGTSLLMAIMLKHSDIYGPLFETACFVGSKKEYGRYLLYEQEAVQAGKTILLEKTPKHIHALGYILGNIPNAHILICIRNPFDVVASLKKRYGDLQKSIDRYYADNVAWLPFKSSRQIHLVKYEEFVADTINQLHKLCAFIGVDYVDSMLEYHLEAKQYFRDVEAKKTAGRAGEEHAQLRNWQLRQPVQDMSGQWRERISHDEYRVIREKLGELALALGYTFNEPYMLP